MLCYYHCVSVVTQLIQNPSVMHNEADMHVLGLDTQVAKYQSKVHDNRNKQWPKQKHRNLTLLMKTDID